ncbi:vacuolar protein sorting-associated protein [Anaeramoeba flamelloides]|uniref:Vacuolar protein sorting-associated protein n=1 Tax=Anaeramoeba flamelloides TaxID=1746091 RepID=A0ABQ8Y9Y9_9EUKA|nr:vacuolar protein sorting-associated protein [Anaeramoeba flamelloides]
MSNLKFQQDLEPNKQEQEESRLSLFGSKELNESTNPNKEDNKTKAIQSTFNSQREKDQKSKTITEKRKKTKSTSHKKKKTKKSKSRTSLFSNSGLHLEDVPLDLTNEIIQLDDFDEGFEEYKNEEEIKNLLEDKTKIRSYMNKLNETLKKEKYSTVSEYFNMCDEYLELNTDLAECDGILESLESLMQSFSTTLSTLSGEIINLKNDSELMSIKLNNRRSVVSELSDFLTHAEISDMLINHLFNDPIDENYIEYIQELDRKLDWSLRSDGDPKALEQFNPIVKKVCKHVLKRITNFFIDTFSNFGNKVNEILIGKITKLFKYVTLIQFVRKHDPKQLLQISYSYRINVAKCCYEMFQSQFKLMQKCLYGYGSKAPLIGYDELSFSIAQKKLSNKNKQKKKTKSNSNKKQNINNTSTFPNSSTNLLTVKERIAILSKIPQKKLINFKEAVKNKQMFSMEIIFSQLILLLTRLTQSEALFSTDFFQDLNLAKEILATSISSLENFITSLSKNSFDVIGIFLMIKINNKYSEILQTEIAGIIKGLFNRINMTLWPQFTRILEINAQSLFLEFDNTLLMSDFNFSNNLSNEKKLQLIKKNKKKQQKKKKKKSQNNNTAQLRPTFSTRKYSELISSILILNNDLNENNVLFSLSLLRTEMETYLSKYASQLIDTKSQTLFLINNYDLILSVLSKNEIISAETQRFELLLEEQHEIYIEEVLKQYFNDLITFVGKTDAFLFESKLEKSEREKRKKTINRKQIGKILKNFSKNWRDSINSIYQEIIRDFNNYTNGAKALKRALSQMLRYYTRLTEIIKLIEQNSNNFSNLIVNLSTIMKEVKDICKTFID